MSAAPVAILTFDEDLAGVDSLLGLLASALAVTADGQTAAGRLSPVGLKAELSR